MGYPMETIEQLVKQAKEINRNRIVDLNQRDLQQNGIENDWARNIWPTDLDVAIDIQRKVVIE